MQKAIIKGGESLSNAISLWNAKHIGLVVPSCWTAADITFKTGGEDFALCDLYDADGEVKFTPSGGQSISLPVDVFAPWRSMAIRSGTSAVPVEQTGDSAATAVLDFGDDRTLTFTFPKGGDYNGVGVRALLGNTPTLSVTEDSTEREILICLNWTAAAENTAAKIQAAIRAEEELLGLDVTAVTVAESAEYAAARPAGTRSEMSYEFFDETDPEVPVSLGMLTIYSAVAGPAGIGCVDPIAFGVNDTDDLAVVWDDTEGVLNILLAKTTASKNAGTLIQNALNAATLPGTVPWDVHGTYAVAANSTWTASPAVAFDSVESLGRTLGTYPAYPREKVVSGGGKDCEILVVLKE